MNKKLEKLRKALDETVPIHDTPIGVLHPYWARKPMNIIEKLIENLSDSEDLILDPFMGSGTFLFAAAKLNRRVIGTDINPLSTFIVESTLELFNLSYLNIQHIKEFISNLEIKLLDLFKVESNVYLERIRYSVRGEFENGNFNLQFTEAVTKEFIKGKWTNRRVIKEFKESPIPEKLKKYIFCPLNFSLFQINP